jgi:hypothetical protein
VGFVREVDEVRTRLYVNGSVVHEDTWRLPQGLSQLDRIMRKYARAIELAERDDVLYAVEIHDPHGPPEHRTARWGNDASVMDNPAPSHLTKLMGNYVDGCLNHRHYAEGGCFAHSLN